MGYDAYGTVVFGKKISKDNLTAISKVRSCNHTTDLSQPFCSQCGKPLYILEKTFIAPEGSGKALGYFTSSAETDDGVLGFQLAQTNSADLEYYAVPDIKPEMSREILDFFKEHSIACCEEDLKIYLYTYQSY